MRLPSSHTYGDYCGYYGAHALAFELPGEPPNGGTFWFSYKTLVAFYHPSKGRIVHTNDWGPTTGKHLNAIDGGAKKGRYNSEDFVKLYAEAYADTPDPDGLLAEQIKVITEDARIARRRLTLARKSMEKIEGMLVAIGIAMELPAQHRAALIHLDAALKEVREALEVPS